MKIFSDIPTDIGVRILAEHAVIVGGYDATHQWWLDDDSILGDSIIFRSDSLRHMADSDVINMVRESSLSKNKDSFTISHHGAGEFTFVSYDFELNG